MSLDLNNIKYLQNRRSFSLRRIAALKKHLKKVKINDPNLCIFAAGSYGRLTASKHSDLDLFFVHSGKNISNIKKIEIDSNLIKFCKKNNLPEFSDDGDYLKIHYLNQIKKILGSPEDDYKNSFTVRMLMLLESYPVYNQTAYMRIIKDFIRTYFRDYKRHPNDFHTMFLDNDIIRFWKTFCLNYEHRRNTKHDAMKAQIRNLKLKFSRIFTCFSMVVAIMGLRKMGKISEKNLTKLILKTPIQRLEWLESNFEDLEKKQYIKFVIKNYCWFLRNTDKNGKELIKWISQPVNKKEAEFRAEKFGDNYFDIIEHVGGRNTLRYLVI